MIPCRLIGPWISRSLLATVLVIATLLGASPAWAQGEPRRPALAPKLSEAEKDPPLRERDRLRVVVVRLAQAGKLNGAVDAAMKELEFTRTIVGELHEDVISSVQMLAKLHEARADWAAARKALQEVMTIRERQPNRRDWRIADARRALADLDRRAALEPRQAAAAPGSAIDSTNLPWRSTVKGSQRTGSIRAAKPWRFGASY